MKWDKVTTREKAVPTAVGHHERHVIGRTLSHGPGIVLPHGYPEGQNPRVWLGIRTNKVLMKPLSHNHVSKMSRQLVSH